MSTEAAPTGASATSRLRPPWPSATRAGPTSRRRASSSIPATPSPTSTPSGFWAPSRAVMARLEEGFTFAAIGRNDVDDLLALDQVEEVEALAELTCLG